MTHVVECQARDPCHCCHDLQVTFVEMPCRAFAVEVNRTHDLARNQKRDAEHRAYVQFRQSLNMGESDITGDVADHKADTIASNALHYSTAHANRVGRPLHSVPANRRIEFLGAIEEQYGPAFGRNHVEDEAQELPLQRFLVPDATDA